MKGLFVKVTVDNLDEKFAFLRNDTDELREIANQIAQAGFSFKDGSKEIFILPHQVTRMIIDPNRTEGIDDFMIL